MITSMLIYCTIPYYNMIWYHIIYYNIIYPSRVDAGGRGSNCNDTILSVIVVILVTVVIAVIVVVVVIVMISSGFGVIIQCIRYVHNDNATTLCIHVLYVYINHKEHNTIK